MTVNENEVSTNREDKESKPVSLSTGVCFEYVSHIPQREFHYTLSTETKELIAVLSGAKPGSTLRFSVSKNQPRQMVERKLRRLRDRLKVAVKHAPGYWEVRRRRSAYHARRAPEEEYHREDYDGKY